MSHIPRNGNETRCVFKGQRSLDITFRRLEHDHTYSMALKLFLVDLLQSVANLSIFSHVKCNFQPSLKGGLLNVKYTSSMYKYVYIGVGKGRWH